MNGAGSGARNRALCRAENGAKCRAMCRAENGVWNGTRNGAKNGAENRAESGAKNGGKIGGKSPPKGLGNGPYLGEKPEFRNQKPECRMEGANGTSRMSAS